jgi:hypothetical protein
MDADTKLDDNLNLTRMADLVIEIERLRHEFQPMPDNIMDHLTAARWDLAEIVMNTQAETKTDLAAKIRMLAATNKGEDSFDLALIDGLAICAAEAEVIGRDVFGLKVAA